MVNSHFLNYSLICWSGISCGESGNLVTFPLRTVTFPWSWKLSPLAWHSWNSVWWGRWFNNQRSGGEGHHSICCLEIFVQGAVDEFSQRSGGDALFMFDILSRQIPTVEASFSDALIGYRKALNIPIFRIMIYMILFCLRVFEFRTTCSFLALFLYDTHTELFVISWGLGLAVVGKPCSTTPC